MSWTQQHGLPPFLDDDIKRFFDQQWTLHTRELAKNPRFSFQKIKHLQQWLPKEAILHHADHEQAKLTVFVLGCIFKALGIHGMILNFFADYPFPYEQAQQRIHDSIALSHSKEIQVGYQSQI